ncbi:MAG: hypothetical protein Q8O89_05785 [Nanoarchaeota archaeon]|nr:hypothetical protein [Nanoarchaeota archaeon]
MENQKLRIGIPNGSLINPERGGLATLLEDARIYVKNLGNNKPLEIENIPWLYAMVGRPQEFPAQAAQGELDVFFGGDDWVKEWTLQGKENEKILGLGIGRVDLVVTKQNFKTNPDLIKVYTEYPFITEDYFKKQGKQTQRIRMGQPISLEQGVVVIESCGTTEAKQYYGLCDAIVEATQSGSALRNFCLDSAKLVLSSEAGLFASAQALKEEWKYEKIDRIKTMLKGVIDARGKDLVIFNVVNTQLEEVLNYIRENRLFAQEETVVYGKTTAQITLELKTNDPKMPLIDVIGDLRQRGANAIDGLPIKYSINENGK